MLVKRFADAKAYEAPNHRGMRRLRLQGFEPAVQHNQWVGLSHFLPGGGAGPDASPIEKVYVVLSRRTDSHRRRRARPCSGPNRQSCTIPPSETREIVNRGNDMATMLVVDARIRAGQAR